MTKILASARSNILAVIAIFVALGGTSYAAFAIPTNSVGSRQLKNHSIGPVKLDRSTIAGYVRDWITIDSTGTIVGSRPHAHLLNWGTTSTPSGGIVSWGNPPSGGHLVPTSCFAVATTSISGLNPSYASAFVTVVERGNKQNVAANVRISAPQQGVDVAVICPQP
ncbi:MAG: hypothetical protein ACRDNK_21155 [Solirubrobacteraceae bacterium]